MPITYPLPRGAQVWDVRGTDGAYTATRPGYDDGSRAPVVIAWTPSHLAVKLPGRTYNPGSRHSGLSQYYASTVEVFSILERDGMRLLVKPLGLEWPARTPQQAVTAPTA